MYDRIQAVRESIVLRVLMYVCTVCMAGYPSVSCNRIIENKKNKNKKKKK